MIVKQTCASRARRAINAEIMCPPCGPAPHQQQLRNLKATPTSAVVKSSSRVKMLLTSGCFCLCLSLMLEKVVLLRSLTLWGRIAGQIAVICCHDGLRVEKKQTFAIVLPSASLSVLQKQITESLR